MRIIQFKDIFKIFRKDDNIQEFTPTTTSTVPSVNINDILDADLTALKALQCSAVWACVSLISESIAGLPIDIISYKDDKYTTISNHPVKKLLEHPNEFQNGFDFIDWVLNSLLLTGNAYIYKVIGSGGEVLELLPLPPYAVSVTQNPDWSLTYQVNFNNINAQVVTNNIIHIKGKSLDGYRGLSPIACSRCAIQLNLKAQEYGLNFFLNGAAPKGILKHPNALSKEAKQRLKDSFDSNFSGSNSFKTMVLEEGLDYQQISISNADAEFMASRKFGVTEISRIFRVPAHLINSTETVSSWGSGLYELNRAFLQMSLLPWIRRIETALNDALIADPDEKIRLNADGFLRGDTKTRYESYKTALSWGWLSVNEVRALERMNPVEGGDRHLQPLNYTDLANPEPAANVTPVGESFPEGGEHSIDD